MEVTILAIVCPAIRCEWNLATWQEATITTVCFTFTVKGRVVLGPLQTQLVQYDSGVKVYLERTLYQPLMRLLIIVRPVLYWDQPLLVANWLSFSSSTRETIFG